MTSTGNMGRQRTPSAIPHLYPLPTARPAPVHVLVIEDHDDTREILDMLLRTEGYEVTLAADGFEGIARYRERAADVVLVDVFMPRKDGVETIRELVRDFPDVTCVAMSADGDPMRRNALDEARLVGARLTLRKPIEPWVLLRTLQGAVAGRRRAGAGLAVAAG